MEKLEVILGDIRTNDETSSVAAVSYVAVADDGRRFGPIVLVGLEALNWLGRQGFDSLQELEGSRWLGTIDEPGNLQLVKALKKRVVES